MSLFQKFAEHCRQSNQSYLDGCERRSAAEADRYARERAYKENLKCCANCLYYSTTPHLGDGRPCCLEQRVTFDWSEDSEYSAYRRVCDEFYRKV